MTASEPSLDPLASLAASYTGLLATLRGLDDEQSWAPTGCPGWSVRDLTHHCWSDAQRALVALHTPTDSAPDLDGTSYWGRWGNDPAAAVSGRRFTRVSASMFLHWDQLRDEYDATARAVLHAAAATPRSARVATQGHVMGVGSVLSTLAVEATIHHLDLVVHLPGVDGPAAESVQSTRQVVDAVALQVGGQRFPPEWDDAVVVRAATGREEAQGSAREALGALADRLPLFA